MEVLEVLGWEHHGSAEHWEAAGPGGCGADVLVPFAGRAGEGSQPLGTWEWQQFAAVEWNLMHQTSIWMVEVEVARDRRGGVAPEHHQPCLHSLRLSSSKDGFTSNLLNFNCV